MWVHNPPLDLRLSLPANMAMGKSKTWSSCGVTDLPLATLPLDEGDESELLYYLCTEVNRLLNAGLDSQLSTNRGVAGQEYSELLLFVGGGHAERLATAARALGKNVDLVPLSEITQGEIGHAAKAVREKVADLPPAKRQHALVIYAILDDKLFMARAPDGGQAPCKPPKKIYIMLRASWFWPTETG